MRPEFGHRLLANPVLSLISVQNAQAYGLGHTRIIRHMRANKINILFVEDDPLIREGLSEFVSARFFNSVAVGDGLRALQILAEQPIDVIVTDIVLPGGLSGVELATRAKAMFPKVPVIFMTGYLSTVRAAEMPGLVLYKPVGAKELEAAIRRSLRN